MKRKDISDILNSGMETDEMLKALLNKFHEETDTLKDQNDELQKQLENMKSELEAANDGKAAAEKALQEHKDAVEAEKTAAAKTELFRDALKKAGIKSDYIDKVLKHSKSDINALELDENGKIKDAAKVRDAIKSEWSEYIVSVETSGAPNDNPPKNTGHSMTKEQIMGIKDAGDRQRAIAANPELFGITN